MAEKLRENADVGGDDEKKPAEREKYPMKKVCVVCRKDMGIAGDSFEKDQTSHGYCSDCQKKLMKEWRLEDKNIQ